MEVFLFSIHFFRGVIFSLAKKKVLQTLWLCLVFFSSFSFFANFVVLTFPVATLILKGANIIERRHNYKTRGK